MKLQSLSLVLTGLASLAALSVMAYFLADVLIASTLQIAVEVKIVIIIVLGIIVIIGIAKFVRSMDSVELRH